MKQPLALLLYERILPGSQLVNRMQDLGYRVQPLASPSNLTERSRKERPLLVLADLEPWHGEALAAISDLRKQIDTSHIPVLAFAAVGNETIMTAGREAGATLVVNDAAILAHLHQFLEQALQVD